MAQVLTTTVSSALSTVMGHDAEGGGGGGGNSGALAALGLAIAVTRTGEAMLNVVTGDKGFGMELRGHAVVTNETYAAVQLQQTTVHVKVCVCVCVCVALTLCK